MCEQGYLGRGRHEDHRSGPRKIQGILSCLRSSSSPQIVRLNEAANILGESTDKNACLLDNKGYSIGIGRMKLVTELNLI